MKRKIINIMLASALVLSTLAGCEQAVPMAEAPPEISEEAQAGAEETAGATETTTPDGTEAAGGTETAAFGGTMTAASGETAAAAAVGAGIGSTEIAAEIEPAADIDYTTGTPWLCSFLDGNVTADTPAPDLKDDFFLAVNRDELISRVIPEGYSSCGTMNDVSMQKDEDIKNLFTENTEADSHDAQLALDLYSVYMDWDTRNDLGVTPLGEEVDKVEEIDTIEALTDYFSRTPLEDQLGSIYDVGATEDFEDSSVRVLFIQAGGLLLDDSAEYRELTSFGAVKKEARTELADKILQKLGYTGEEAAQKIENCLAFETELAQVMLTSEQMQQPDIISRINNHFTREEIMEAQGDLPILNTLEVVMGYPETDDYILTEPEWLEKLNELYTDENLTKIRDCMIVNAAVASATSLDRECYEWGMECRNKINGASGLLPDETVISGTVASILPWPVAQLYTEKYLDEEDKERISDLIDEILEEYHGVIEEADFLSDETKEAAIGKLDAIHKGVLWPDDWSKYDCEGLEIASAEDGGTLWETTKAISRYYTAKNVKEFQEPVDKEEWGNPPTVFNCFYSPLTNTITILGAFARGELYYSDMSDEELYAKLGMVIGHEISHAFDSTGAQFDKDGNMDQWWTEDDWNAFQERNEKLVAYYDAIHPWEGQDYMASIKSGEACADMGGMKCVLRIAADQDDFDYDKFFRAYADLWCSKGTLNAAYSYIRDTHPFSYLRVNCVLQQFDEFLDCYGIKEGDGMYLAPEDRVAIW